MKSRVSIRGIKVLKKIIKTAPECPGIYKMMGAQSEVLYVGKAKNIKMRLKNYANPQNLTPRLLKMMTLVVHVQHTETETELEALWLEHDLIKHFKPRFNVLLKDDKTFGYIQIMKTHPFPRLAKYKGKQDDDAFYYGPFPVSHVLDETIVCMQKLFRMRSCTDNEFARRKRPCLQYHINRCSAPCVQMINEASYRETVYQAQLFLEGRIDELQAIFFEKMQACIAQKDEQAKALYRDKIALIYDLQAKHKDELYHRTQRRT